MRQYKMKTKVNEIYIQQGPVSSGKRIYTWPGLAGKVFFDSFFNMGGARSNSCQKLVLDINTVKDEKIYSLNSFWWLKGKNIQHFQAQVN